MPDIKSFVAGGGASCIAEAGTFPLDLVKTRMQVQGQLGGGGGAETGQLYRNSIHCAYSTIRKEGFFGVYNGVSAAMLRQVVYGTLKMGLYVNLKENSNRFIAGGKDNYFVNLLCGGIAGVLSGAIANPTDVMKVRFQTNNARFQNLSLAQAFAITYREEGLAGLYRGVVQTSQRAALVAASELPVYDLTKRMLIKHSFREDAVLTHFLSGAWAGIVTSVVICPVDVCRSRLMNQQLLKEPVLAPSTGSNGAAVVSEAPLIYRSGTHCLMHTIKTEGIFALYKGFVPNAMRLGPWNVLFFMSYEQLSRSL